MSENEITKQETVIPKEKVKNPKRVAAGKKIAEAKKIKLELKRKEIENTQSKSIGITKDDNDEVNKQDNNKGFTTINIYKNYLPLCLIGVVGIGLYFYNSKQVKQQRTVKVQHQPIIQREQSLEQSLEQTVVHKPDNNNIGSW